jgi:hypothetical protein
VTGLIVTGVILATVITMTIVALKKARKVWHGVPAAGMRQVKCLKCRGGFETLLNAGDKDRTPLGWGRIPDHLLLLHRRPDSEGGDKWGTPLANIRDCPCCHALGMHLVPAGEDASWLACYRPSGKPDDATPRRPARGI